MAAIRIVLVDDHPLYREGVKKAITSFSDLAIVGEAGNGHDGMDLLRSTHPDVAILDVNLPDENGLQIARRMGSELPDTKIILLTGYTDTEQPLHAFRAGAHAYCAKDIEHEQLAEIIRLVSSGKWVYEGQIMDAKEKQAWLDEQIAGMKPDATSEDLFAPLTHRESEILNLVARGLTNKQIGYLLGISEQTVKNHLTSLLRKIGASDRTQAVVYALKHGWIRLPEDNESMEPSSVPLPKEE
ncbi:MAG: response regulator [Anaerolineales bacterium]|jgi:DNA-binding NarL/FixJ family response regulator